MTRNEPGVSVSMHSIGRREKDVRLTLNTLRDGQQDAGDEGFTVMGLLEDHDLLAKT